MCGLAGEREGRSSKASSAKPKDPDEQIVKVVGNASGHQPQAFDLLRLLNPGGEPALFFVRRLQLSCPLPDARFQGDGGLVQLLLALTQLLFCPL